MGPQGRRISGPVEDDHGFDKAKARQRATMACVNCRKRKIRCDSKQPACSTCERLGKLCDYEPISEQENLIAREKKRQSRLRRSQMAAVLGRASASYGHSMPNAAQQLSWPSVNVPFGVAGPSAGQGLHHPRPMHVSNEDAFPPESRGRRRNSTLPSGSGPMIQPYLHHAASEDHLNAHSALDFSSQESLLTSPYQGSDLSLVDPSDLSLWASQHLHGPSPEGLTSPQAAAQASMLQRWQPPHEPPAPVPEQSPVEFEGAGAARRSSASSSLSNPPWTQLSPQKAFDQPLPTGAAYPAGSAISRPATGPAVDSGSEASRPSYGASSVGWVDPMIDPFAWSSASSGGSLQHSVAAHSLASSPALSGFPPSSGVSHGFAAVGMPAGSPSTSHVASAMDSMNDTFGRMSHGAGQRAHGSAPGLTTGSNGLLPGRALAPASEQKPLPVGAPHRSESLPLSYASLRQAEAGWLEATPDTVHQAMVDGHASMALSGASPLQSANAVSEAPSSQPNTAVLSDLLRLPPDVAAPTPLHVGANPVAFGGGYQMPAGMTMPPYGISSTGHMGADDINSASEITPRAAPYIDGDPLLADAQLEHERLQWMKSS